MRLALSSLVFCCALLPVIAAAQETSQPQPVAQPNYEVPFDASYFEELEEELRGAKDDEPSWSPTGDALWDAYVAAMEAHLDIPPPRNETILAPYLDDAVLAQWESRFAADPRYWQLRYWNATYAIDRGAELDIEPIEFVRSGIARGAVDAAALWLIYRSELAELDELEERFVAGTATSEDMARIAAGGLSNMPYESLVNLRNDLAARLAEALPDESRPWYEWAFRRFEFGDWHNGLQYLQRGNEAPLNRKLDPFPLSFVKARIVSGEPVGSEAVAGTVMDQAYSVIPIPNFIRPKDHARELQIRLNVGTDVSEAGIWHRWTMRSALMEGADTLDRLVMVVISGVLTKHLLVDMGGSLEVEQREDLWQLHHRIRGVSEMIRRDNETNLKMSEYLTEHLSVSAGELAEQLIFNEVWPPTEDEEEMRIDELRELFPNSTEEELKQIAEAPAYYRADHAIFEIRRRQHEWSFSAAVEEYAGESAQKMRERFTRALDFDFTTLRWREEATSEAD